MKNKHDVRFAKFVVVLNALVPGAILSWDALHQQLGANGVNFALHTTGLLSLIFLCLTLSVTPLRRLTGLNTLIAYRRALGLLAFGYAAVHFLIFFLFDRGASVASTLHEILSRRYLWVGTTGLLLMVPLAVTSTNAMVMRLGARRWKALHRLVYVVVIAGALHYYMLVKSDVRQPLVFAAVLFVLLAFRIVRALVDRRHHPHVAGRTATATATGTPTATATATAPPTSSRPVGSAARSRPWQGSLRVARVFDETPDVRTFRFTTVGVGPLPFEHQPGQYLNLALDIGGKRVNRSYTIASSPTRSHYCEITVKRSATGPGSWHLHDSIVEGDTVKVSAPAGRFVFTGEGADRVVLLAGGVGVTPLMAIVRYLTDRCWPGQIHLVMSVRKRHDLIFRDELAYLQTRFPNLHVLATLTKDEGTDRTDWQGARGAISKDLLLKFIPDLATAPVFLCGPDGMMAAMRELLGRLGVPAANLQTEAFISPRPGADATPLSDAAGATTEAPVVSATMEPSSPPSIDADAATDRDAGDQLGRVHFVRSKKFADLSPELTLLETAEAAGIDFPFECRAGICGQCKTKLIAGRVTMDSEDALSAAEKARGFILACQSHCQGDVTVDA